MGLNINTFFKNKTIKLSDSFVVYFEDKNPLEMVSCIGFNLPKFSFKEDTFKYGNMEQSFFIPDYNSLDVLKLNFNIYKDDNKDKITEYAYIYRILNTFKPNSQIYHQDYGYTSNETLYGKSTVSSIHILILNNNLNEVVYEYYFNNLTLVDYSIFEYNYNSDTPCNISLSYAFEGYSKINVNNIPLAEYELYTVNNDVFKNELSQKKDKAYTQDLSMYDDNTAEKSTDNKVTISPQEQRKRQMRDKDPLKFVQLTSTTYGRNAVNLAANNNLTKENLERSYKISEDLNVLESELKSINGIIDKKNKAFAEIDALNSKRVSATEKMKYKTKWLDKNWNAASKQFQDEHNGETYGMRKQQLEKQINELKAEQNKLNGIDNK